MTYEKAVKVLVDAGLLREANSEAALAALKDHSVEFTYPDWAQALLDVGAIARLDVDKAVAVMQIAGQKEMEEGGKDFDEALRNAGIL